MFVFSRVLFSTSRSQTLPVISSSLKYTSYTLSPVYKRPVQGFRAYTMTTPPSKMGKRLVVSCDGTWQSADTGSGKDPTNAINFCRALSHNADGSKMEQIMFYQAGVGTGALLPIQKAVSGISPFPIPAVKY